MKVIEIIICTNCGWKADNRMGFYVDRKGVARRVYVEDYYPGGPDNDLCPHCNEDTLTVMEEGEEEI